MSTINITIGNVTLNIGNGTEGDAGTITSEGGGGPGLGEGSEVPVGTGGIRILEAVTTNDDEQSIGSWVITASPFDVWNSNNAYVKDRDYWNWDSPAWPDNFRLVPRALALDSARPGGISTFAVGSFSAASGTPSVNLGTDKLWRMKRWKLVSGSYTWTAVEVWLHRVPGTPNQLKWYAGSNEVMGSPLLLALGAKERVQFEKLSAVPTWPGTLYTLSQSQL